MNANCFHCDLKNPIGQKYQQNVLGKRRYFCCPGCLAIAQTISENNLEDFYRYRSSVNETVVQLLPQELVELEAIDDPEILRSISSSTEDSQIIELGIEGITCAACGWLIKKQISKRPEVQDIQVNTTTRRAKIYFNKGSLASPILKQIRQLGYRAYPFSEDNQEKIAQAENKDFTKRLIVAGLAMMQVMTYAIGLYIGEFQDMSKEHANFLHWLSGLLATPVVFYSAKPFFKSAFNALKQRQFGMNLPVSLAIISGYSASIHSLINQGNVYYFDSIVMFTFFLLVGRFLEHRMRLKALLKQQNFNKLLPISVSRKNQDGTISVVLVSEIKTSEHLIINAGSVVPVDGILLDNEAQLNEAVLTGEFIPVHKLKNDKIISGSTNNAAGFLMQATSTTNNSRLQQLINLQNNTANLTDNNQLTEQVSLADQIASWYVFGLLIICIITAFVWWQINPDQIFPVLLSLLVVSCPCALSLATPAAVAAAIAQLTDKGLMIKGHNTLAKMNKVTDIFFDKTGTLTLGKMSIKETHIYSKIDKETCLQIATTLESKSNHPIAEAFKHLNLMPLTNIETNESIANGVSGIIDNNSYKLGKKQFVASNHKALNNLEINPTNSSQVLLYLTKNDQHIASFVLADKINPTAQKAISSLFKSNYRVSLLSGDSHPSSQHTASALNISSVIANSTPESKLQVVHDTESTGRHVLMVGDGVNDIGALEQASVSITMGTASQLSKSASSAVLISQDLNVISESLLLAKKLDLIIKQNLGWAVTYNIIAIPFAAFGLVPAWAAAIGMTSSSLIVVLNALRLRK
jgi:Cu2+-exporting ATPase